ncbi:MAG: nucleotide sugar dehydrogenase [Planctomycetes bacterium]|nr:nucleotide sugar dehydrogenase [Planctomycetota bacterium]
MQMKLLNLIKSHHANVGIIGMGYVGLPLARVFSSRGFPVTGFDIDRDKITKLNHNKSYIKHIPAQTIKEMRAKHGFKATDDFKQLAKMDAVIICVPTPLTKMKEPDMSYIENTARTISQHIRKGQLIILESTTYPGTTEEMMKPILEKSGLKYGKDFYLAFSPEREDPGNPKYSTEKIPKVVGGLDPVSGKLAQTLYGEVVTQVIPVSSAAVAEATKLLENIYRCVNIAMVNELKMVFERMGIDVWEVIRAASTKPFGFQPFYPGPGLGGHCIPIDPFYLSWKARQYDIPTKFIELAGEINTSMPYYVVNKTAEILNQQGKMIKDAHILILGVAYKKDVDDMRESPALKVIELLLEQNARVLYNDPYVRSFPRLRHYNLPPFSSKRLTHKLLRKQDAVLITTDHTDYDYQWIVNNSKLVIDSRNATKDVTNHRERIKRV